MIADVLTADLMLGLQIITGKRVAPTRERWAEIARTLQRSYAHLRKASRRKRLSDLACSLPPGSSLT